MHVVCDYMFCAINWADTVCVKPDLVTFVPDQLCLTFEVAQLLTN